MDLTQVEPLDQLLDEENNPDKSKTDSSKKDADNTSATKTPDEIAAEEAKAKEQEEAKKKEEEEKAAAEKAKADEKKENENENEEEEEAEPDGILSGLIKRHGITPSDNKQYEESEAGLDLLVNDITETKAKKLLDEHLATVPGLKEFYAFVQAKGNPNKYFELAQGELQYENLKLEDDATKRQVIKNYLTSVLKLKPEDADAKVSKYEAAGMLDDESTTALGVLKASEAEKKQQAINQQLEEDKKQKEQVTKYWTDISTLLKDKTSIKGINIPVNDRDALFKYMAHPVDNNGNSQEMLDIDSEDYETRIALSYLRMKKISIAGLVDKEAETKKANEKRLSFKNAQEDKNKSATSKREGKKLNPDTLHDDLISFTEQERLEQEKRQNFNK